MNYFSSIRSKITLLLFAIIALTLSVSVYLFINKLEALQKEAAHDYLTRAHEQLRLAFSDMDRRLLEVGKSISADKKLLAGVSLISHFQDEANYKPLIFDPPKKELSDILKTYASNAGIQIAAVYVKSMQAEAFYLPSDAGPVSGYVQYSDGGRMIKYTSLDQQTLRPPMYLKDASDLQAGWLLNRVHLRTSKDGSLLYELNIPLSAETPGTSGINMFSKPVIRLGYVIDKSVIEDIARRADAGVHLKFGDTEISGGNTPRMPLTLENSPAEIVALKKAFDAGQLYWEEFSQRSVSYIRGVTQIYVSGQGWALLSLIKNAETLDFGIHALQYTLLWLLPLITMLLLIVGQFFADRTITAPVTKLTELSSELARGSYVKIAISGRDEIGQLAVSFNKMSEQLLRREQELTVTQNRFSNIIDNAPAIIYMKNPDGNYAVVNKNFLHSFGKSEEEVIGLNDRDIFSEEIAEKFIENDRVMINRRTTLEREDSVVLDDGSSRFYHSMRFPLFDDDGEIIALCGILTDITERKAIAKNLSLSRLVIEHASEAIIVTDLNGNIVEVNAAYESITGYTREDIIGQNPRIAKSGRHDSDFYRQMWNEITLKGSWKGEIWDKRKNGELFPKWLSITTVYEAGGIPVNYVGIFSDLSEEGNGPVGLKPGK